MLVLSRNTGQRILIDGGRIEVVVVAIQPGKVRLGVEAPPEVRIDREEVHEARQADVRQAEVRLDRAEARKDLARAARQEFRDYAAHVLEGVYRRLGMPLPSPGNLQWPTARVDPLKNEETSPAPSSQPPVPNASAVDWRRAYLGVCEKLDVARQERDEAIERLVAWKLCPACGLPVPTSGIVCKTGECRCGALVLESDGAAPCDPAAMVAELREQLAVLARQLVAARRQRDEARTQIAASFVEIDKQIAVARQQRDRILAVGRRWTNPQPPTPDRQ